MACALAERFPIGLVSVDSALVYRGLDIGAAKPDAATLARHPHRLIDIRDPVEPYSAAEFRNDALAAIAEIARSGRVPLLVGGTGLYFRALATGLSELPEASAELRARIAEEASRIGWPALHEKLRALDPPAAERIRAGDAQRIQRALEIIELSGRSLSEQTDGLLRRPPWRFLKLALVPNDRTRLHARIEERFDAMLGVGFLDEVRALRARGDLHANLPAVRTVGYRQAFEHLDGHSDAPTFRQRAIFATRQLAKRQITWLRGELDARWFDPDNARSADNVGDAVRAFLGPDVVNS
ncbi:MAG TPA: tRNA (adenosine(37)-N6)-dimethylallyltransferase MiaA [Rhodanobacteraceae bacterium]|nr:tRNA (adenosine(37)-N6)-dimethylallyltransferase MiaA [Rhodanobacteraceae bacterium]